MRPQYIQYLRQKCGLTQEDLASELNISRPTYGQIEQGQRELTFSEAQKLAAIFGVSLQDFEQEKSPSYSVKIEEEKCSFTPKKITMRINVPQKNFEKFKEVLLYILSKIGAKPNVGETVLYKLLYFIDFDFYEKYEEQLIGATYIKNHFGPTPVEFKAIVEKMVRRGEIEKVSSKYFNHPQKKYLPVREADLTKFDARELHHIDDVLMRLGDKNATELSNYSHDDVPWMITEKNQPIAYEAVFYRSSKTSVRNYGEQN